MKHWTAHLTGFLAALDHDLPFNIGNHTHGYTAF